MSFFTGELLKKFFRHTVMRILRHSETENFILRFNSYHAGDCQQPHYHQRSSVSFVLFGRVQESVGDKIRNGQPLSSVVKPAGVIHANRYGDAGTHLLQIELKSERILLPDESWRWHHAGDSVHSFLRLTRLLLCNSAEEELDTAAKCVFANLPPGVQQNEAPRWLKKARKKILARRVRDLTQVHALARKIGVHPVYLTRRFRRHFGETIRSFVHRRRIHLAARLLAETRRPLVEIACDLGYSDQAHFCRQFRKATGTRPSEFRRMVANVQY